MDQECQLKEENEYPVMTGSKQGNLPTNQNISGLRKNKE